ncbi:MAG: hypothetical protein WAV23_00715 [Minisyncoccia bacterium]
MGRNILSDDDYSRVADKAKSKGSATYAAEERIKEGKGLHDLVDPKGHGVIRRSISWYEPKGEIFQLLRGVAMLIETRLDTTGSMGNNVEIAMRLLPTTYDLLLKGKNAVLKRYDLQMITAIFGDCADIFPLGGRSQAEMDIRIAEQMTHMFPEHGGKGNGAEDPQYGLFGGAYLTSSDINKYGLKYYDFTITDEPARDYVSIEDLTRVFGDSVLKKVRENGFEMDENNLPSTKEIVKELSKRAHSFLLFVNDDPEAKNYWKGIYGKDRVVMLPRTELLPEVQASIIGLTEGTLTLQTLEDFLINDAKLDKSDAQNIKRAVAGIPIGAQTLLPNFSKIPLKGDTFTKKGDLWPVGHEGTEKHTKPSKVKNEDESMWK